MGHRTTPVVLNPYFRPGREDFRAVLVKAMPKRTLDNDADQELTFLSRIGAIPNRAVIGQTKVG